MLLAVRSYRGKIHKEYILIKQVWSNRFLPQVNWSTPTITETFDLRCKTATQGREKAAHRKLLMVTQIQNQIRIQMLRYEHNYSTQGNYSLFHLEVYQANPA